MPLQHRGGARRWHPGVVTDDSGRLLILDAPSLYFRAFFGVPPVYAADGTPVNALKGLLEFIALLVNARKPTHLVACLDADWRPAWRVAAVPTYKTHRVATGTEEIVPDDLERQVPLMIAVLDALGIAYVGAAGYEADDVVATLAAHATRPAEVVSGDRDLFQVVDDAARCEGAVHRSRRQELPGGRRGVDHQQVRRPGTCRTLTSRCCAAIRAMVCRVPMGSARRRPLPSSRGTDRGRDPRRGRGPRVRDAQRPAAQAARVT